MQNGIHMKERLETAEGCLGTSLIQDVPIWKIVALPNLQRKH